MNSYISILRGINVGGQRKILMTDLRVLYEQLNFKDVITYIQSGNVIFKTETNASSQDLAKKIEKSISEKFNLNVPVIIRTVKEIESLILSNPFLADRSINIEKLHVTFLKETPKKFGLEKIQNFNYPPDKFIIKGENVFLNCPVNYGRTKLSNKFFEDNLGVSATTRNWKTVRKLFEMANDIQE